MKMGSDNDLCESFLSILMMGMEFINHLLGCVKYGWSLYDKNSLKIT